MQLFPVLVATAALASATALAVPEQGQEPLHVPVTPIAGYPGYDLDALRLVEFQDQAPVWISEREKSNYKAQGINFFDITDTPNLGRKAHLRAQRKTSYPSPNRTDKVVPVLQTLSTVGLEENLWTLTSFRTRHYRSETGRQSQKWLFSKIAEITAQWAPESIQQLITLEEFYHPWGQNSTILRINGSSTTDDGVIVIGAHQDSANLSPLLPAPGADDDGSGTVTILEAYRALVAASFRPVRTVEFHWYAAEEAGLLGSQAVVQDYESRDVNVVAMAQFDMTAWVKRGTREEAGVVLDFTDASLTEFNKQLIEKYLDIPWVETRCGYGCSDHGPWTKAGYPAVFNVESDFVNYNIHIHTVDDRIDISDEFSFPHMLQFSKLAVAFAIELGGWDTA